jgi:glycosyltransferase involved in cell wall biosynthesis
VLEPLTISIPASKPITWRHPERLFRSGVQRDLAFAIGQIRPDVVNSHINTWDRIPTAVRACRAARVPLVHTLHDRFSAGNSGAKALAALKYAHAITTNSASTKRDFEQLASSLSRATVIIPGVDVTAARAAEPLRRERPYIFCAARLDIRGKAIDVLISAFGGIAPDYPELDLLIAGSGRAADELKRQAAEAGLGERIIFPGTVSREELWRLYKGALFYAMPSRRPEGLGMVFLESMACGRPVIGSGTGGTPEIVTHGETGLLLRRNEPGELADAMRTMLDDGEAREAMGRRGLDFASRYTWSSVAESYLKVYGSCLER